MIKSKPAPAELSKCLIGQVNTGLANRGDGKSMFTDTVNQPTEGRDKTLSVHGLTEVCPCIKYPLCSDSDAAYMPACGFI